MLIGRKMESSELLKLCDSDRSEFVAIYGRRRVGKTYLVNEVLGDRMLFRHSGLSRDDMEGQLEGWRSSLADAGVKDPPVVKSWIEAFDALKPLIRSSRKRKKVIFIDEMPWMDTPRSNFVSALEFFWNGWASARHDILLVVCGSATSWIINKVIRNHGGLHNRVTAQIALEPFSLQECEQYARAQGLGMNRRQLMEGYMVMGGVPYYWSLLERGKSITQNIDTLFFARNGKLRNEFTELYHSLFKSPEDYIGVITALSKRKSGLTRNDIAEGSHTANNGRLTTILADLEQCGFIRRFSVVGKKSHDAIYQLTDHFTLFYFQFMEGNASEDEQFWSKCIGRPVYNTWAGLAFERLCFSHIEQIKRAIGIAAVSTNVFAWRAAADEVYGPGAQIDMLIDRQDQVVNLCEMKYSAAPYAIDKELADSLQYRRERFIRATKNRKAIHLTMITANGLLRNAYAGEIQCEVTADELFGK